MAWVMRSATSSPATWRWSSCARWRRCATSGWRWAPLAVLNPLYWVLHSWASWRALIQLVRNPFLWEKTPHGLHEAQPPAAPPQPEPPAAAPLRAI